MTAGRVTSTVERSGGAYALAGFAYQLLGTLEFATEVAVAGPQADPGRSFTVTLEPPAGDAVHGQPAGKTTIQFKTRGRRGFSEREVATQVLKDLHKAALTDPNQNFVLRTNARAAWSPAVRRLGELIARAGLKAGLALAEREGLRFMASGHKGGLSARAHFAWLLSIVAPEPSGRQAGERNPRDARADAEALGALLARFTIHDQVDEAKVLERVRENIQTISESTEDAYQLELKLFGLLFTLAAEGDRTVTVETLFAQCAIDTASLRGTVQVKAALRRRFAEAMARLGYDRAGDSRTTPTAAMSTSEPVLLQGPSGVGKTWALARAAVDAEEAGAVVIWIDLQGKTQEGLRRDVVRRVQAARGYTGDVNPHALAQLLSMAAGHGPPLRLVVCLDRFRNPDEAFDLVSDPWWAENGVEVIGAFPASESESVNGSVRIVRVPPFPMALDGASILNHPLPDDTKTDMSGSRILGLSSTRRQDFTSSFHHLGKAFQRTLDVVPSRGPALLSIHALAKREAKRSDAPSRISIDLPDRKSVIFEDTLDLIDWRQTPAHASGSDINIPRAFADHVARVPLADLEPIIVAALGIEAAASVWRRLLGAQRLETRRGRTDALLWPIATNPAVLESPDLARDAIDYIRAAYSTTSDDDRRAFEETVLAWNPKDAKRWRVQLARLLTALPPDHIATEEMRRRRSDLEREGGLAGNPAAISHAPDSARFLRAGSSTPAATPTAEAEGRLARALANHGRGPNERRVKALWSAIVKTVDLIERDTLDPESSTELWRAVGEALIHLVASSAWMSGETAQPPKDAVLALLRRIIALSAPTERDYQPTPRGRAGVALLHMAARFPDEAPALLDIIRELVIDPNPGVRETVADRLCWLNKDLPEMAWPLIDQMAATETDHTVLTVLLAHTLNSLSPSDPDRVEAALRVIDGRAHELEPGEHTQVIEMISHVAVRLAVETGRPSAMTLIEDWTATSPTRRSALRSAAGMTRLTAID